LVRERSLTISETTTRKEINMIFGITYNIGDNTVRQFVDLPEVKDSFTYCAGLADAGAEDIGVATVWSPNYERGQFERVTPDGKSWVAPMNIDGSPDLSGAVEVDGHGEEVDNVEDALANSDNQGGQSDEG
jgi:hypothetical protein